MIYASKIVAYFKRAAAEGWGYVGGANGELYTPALAQLWANTRNGHPDSYYLKDCARWFGKMVADCSGGIVGACREQDTSFYDRTANTFKAQFVQSGSIKTIPEIPGIAVWKSGHIGIYIGGGKAIEFRGYKYGAVITNVSSRPWKYWGKLKGVFYDTVTVETPALIISKVLKFKSRKTCDPQVIALQERLKELGYYSGKIDGWYWKGTKTAVIAFQDAFDLQVDGKVGRETTTALGGVWQGK